ncbi:hypothetical protein ACVINU_000417 [Bradyrhizobium diazoefficiens]
MRTLAVRPSAIEHQLADAHASALVFERHVGDGRAAHELHALPLQPVGKRLYDRVILVVDGTLDPGEGFDAREFAHEAVQIAPQLDRAVPGLEGESGLPHVPEIGLEEFWRQPVGDAAVAERLLRGLGEPQQLEPVAPGKAHVGDVDLEAVAVNQPRPRMRRVLLVERDGLVAHAQARTLERGDARQQVPGAFVMVGSEHASAAQRIGAVREQCAVETAADQRLRLVNHDVAPRQLRVANQERRARERSDATTDEIRLHDLPRLQFELSGRHCMRASERSCAGSSAMDRAFKRK